jgi:hypothetical protein
MSRTSERSYTKAENVEVDENCKPFSSSSKLLGKPNWQFERGNVKRGLKRKEELQAPTFSLERKVSQDGPGLKLKIRRIKPASSTMGLSSPSQTRGCPVEPVLPSACKKKTSSSRSRSRRRTSSSSVADESWIPSSKRMRVSSLIDRYRELRDRNNEASRKSRQNRKARESEMREVAVKLASENQSLKIRADEMERLIKKLREALLEAMMKTKKSTSV